VLAAVPPGYDGYLSFHFTVNSQFGCKVTKNISYMQARAHFPNKKRVFEVQNLDN
jgi:hypothetical protein